MSFLGLRVSSFRNLADGELMTDARRVFLVGENGQGKTNFLEALYYLCYGASFRGAVDAQVPARGSPGFFLSGTWEADPPETISVRFADREKDIRLNGKPLHDRKELVSHNPAVVFCHEDFSFADGEPERRRFFFDQCASMLSVAYIDTLRSYKRILKQRNAAIRDADVGLIEALDLQFAGVGLELMRDRLALLEAFAPRFPAMYEAVSLVGRKVDLDYRPSWPVDADIPAVAARLEAAREGEIAFGTSLSGPHRDRWIFRSEGADFAATASTGQLRLASLILRAVQAALYAERAGKWPVLLLDDVLLELDVGKRRRFLALLPGPETEAQAFFTFLPEEPWQEYSDSDTLVYRVDHGRFAH
ncbi:MAG: DNA replication and repair protein RecF [Rectinemataceae bacterium]